MLTLKAQAMSQRQIVAASGVSPARVNRTCKKRKIEEDSPNITITGPPRKLGARADRFVTRKVSIQGTGAGVKITQNLAPNFCLRVSVKTVTRSLKRRGFRAGPKTKKPLLSAVHREKRLLWARVHRNWTIED